MGLPTTNAIRSSPSFVSLQIQPNDDEQMRLLEKAEEIETMALSSQYLSMATSIVALFIALPITFFTPSLISGAGAFTACCSFFKATTELIQITAIKAIALKRRLYMEFEEKDFKQADQYAKTAQTSFYSEDFFRETITRFNWQCLSFEKLDQIVSERVHTHHLVPPFIA